MRISLELEKIAAAITGQKTMRVFAREEVKEKALERKNEKECLVNRACDPEDYFEALEKCKKCGRIV